ncbi:hypothetical protein M1437_01550 [Patescibacteria group bacterium]|nr:hypothetical protein [Patescibacteria group bacterium]
MPTSKNFSASKNIFRLNQQGVVPPAIIIGVILVIGAILVISNFNKINLVNIPLPNTPKSTGSWLYKVDLKNCQTIVDKANLNDELQVIKDPQATWQHSCSLSSSESANKSFGLREFIIDAIYDEQGIIDPVGNAVKFHSKDPILNFVAMKYVGKNYKDIYQEPDAISNNFEAYRDSIGQGQGTTIYKQGTFPTTEGQGAYFIIRYENVTVDYTGYSHAKKGSCNLYMWTDSTDNKTKLEEQLVQMVQKIDKAIKGECGTAKN